MSSKELRQKAKTIAKEYEYLPYMIERYLALWGEEETMQFLKACEQPIRTSIRINTLRAETEKVLATMKRKGVDLEMECLTGYLDPDFLFILIAMNGHRKAHLHFFFQQSILRT